MSQKCLIFVSFLPYIIVYLQSKAINRIFMSFGLLLTLFFLNQYLFFLLEIYLFRIIENILIISNKFKQSRADVFYTRPNCHYIIPDRLGHIMVPFPLLALLLLEFLKDTVQLFQLFVKFNHLLFDRFHCFCTLSNTFKISNEFLILFSNITHSRPWYLQGVHNWDEQNLITQAFNSSDDFFISLIHYSCQCFNVIQNNQLVDHIKEKISKHISYLSCHLSKSSFISILQHRSF